MNQTTTTHKNDWEAIERDYRAGLLSLREMSSAHGVSHVTIKKRADREGWTRSLQPKIMARTEEIMARAEEIVEQGATKEIAVVLARDESEAAHCELMARDDDLIEANSRRIAAVRMGHRKQITRMAGLSMTLLVSLRHKPLNWQAWRSWASSCATPTTPAWTGSTTFTNGSSARRGASTA
jgi:hypothetical protein